MYLVLNWRWDSSGSGITVFDLSEDWNSKYLARWREHEDYSIQLFNDWQNVLAYISSEVYDEEDLDSIVLAHPDDTETPINIDLGEDE
jgi:hypothetical protein